MEQNFDSMLNVSAVPQDDKKQLLLQKAEITETTVMNYRNRSLRKWQRTVGDFSSI